MSGHGWRFSLITGVLIHSLFVQKHHNFLLNLILNSLERTKKPIAITLTRPSLPSSHVQATRKGFELQKISFVALKTLTEKKIWIESKQKIVLYVTWRRRRKRLCTLHGVHERKRISCDDEGGCRFFVFSARSNERQKNIIDNAGK